MSEESSGMLKAVLLLQVFNEQITAKHSPLIVRKLGFIRNNVEKGLLITLNKIENHGQF